jgi:hypothetical protein
MTLVGASRSRAARLGRTAIIEAITGASFGPHAANRAGAVSVLVSLSELIEAEPMLRDESPMASRSSRNHLKV